MKLRNRFLQSDRNLAPQPPNRVHETAYSIPSSGTTRHFSRSKLTQSIPSVVLIPGLPCLDSSSSYETARPFSYPSAGISDTPLDQQQAIPCSFLDPAGPTRSGQGAPTPKLIARKAGVVYLISAIARQINSVSAIQRSRLPSSFELRVNVV